MMNIHISIDHPSFLVQWKEGISWLQDEDGGGYWMSHSFGREFFFLENCHLADL